MRVLIFKARRRCSDMTVGIPWTFIDTSEQHVNQSMGLFKNLFKSKPAEPSFQVADDAIVAPANGNIIDITTVSDPMFAQKLMVSRLPSSIQKTKSPSVRLPMANSRSCFQLVMPLV